MTSCQCSTPLAAAPEVLCDLAILHALEPRLRHLQCGACWSFYSEDGVIPVEQHRGLGELYFVVIGSDIDMSPKRNIPPKHAIVH